MGCEVGTISLQEYMLNGDTLNYLDHGTVLSRFNRKGYKPGNRNEKSPVDHLPCCSRVAGKAVKNSPGKETAMRFVKPALPPVHICNDCFFHDLQGIAFRFPTMNDNREIAPSGNINLFGKDFTLNTGRRKIVVIVETDFADCDDFRMMAKFFNFFKRFLTCFQGIMRVKPNTCVNEVIFFRQL